MKSFQIVEIMEVYFFCGGGVLILKIIEDYFGGLAMVIFFLER